LGFADGLKGRLDEKGKVIFGEEITRLYEYDNE